MVILFSVMLGLLGFLAVMVFSLTVCICRRSKNKDNKLAFRREKKNSADKIDHRINVSDVDDPNLADCQN